MFIMFMVYSIQNQSFYDNHFKFHNIHYIQETATITNFQYLHIVATLNLELLRFHECGCYDMKCLFVPKPKFQLLVIIP